MEHEWRIDQLVKDNKVDKHLEEFKPIIHVDIKSGKILLDNRAAYYRTCYAKA